MPRKPKQKYEYFYPKSIFNGIGTSKPIMSSTEMITVERVSEIIMAYKVIVFANSQN